MSIHIRLEEGRREGCPLLPVLGWKPRQHIEYRSGYPLIPHHADILVNRFTKLEPLSVDGEGGMIGGREVVVASSILIRS